MQRCFSSSATQENDAVMRSPLRLAILSAGREDEGGRQVATVKASTSLRMKNLGNVPPRLETLRSGNVLVRLA